MNDPSFASDLFFPINFKIFAIQSSSIMDVYTLVYGRKIVFYPNGLILLTAACALNRVHPLPVTSNWEYPNGFRIKVEKR